MGVFRKMTSMSSMGLVNFRSSKERTARYTRQTRNAARQQNLNDSLDYLAARSQRKKFERARRAEFDAEIEAREYVTARKQAEAQLEAQRYEEAQQQLRRRKHAAAQEDLASTAIAGWFIDPQNQGRYRWFDGYQWTEHTYPG